MPRLVCLLLAVGYASGLGFSSASNVHAVTLTGYAAMGASETQGNSHNGSWVPYLAVDRGLYFGAGMSNNRAVGGSTSTTLLNPHQQHTQVRNLIQNGSADLAFLSIGGLDVPPVALQIITGSLNVPTWANGVVGRITTAIDTVLSANPKGMVVMGLPDMTLVPGAQSYTAGAPELAAPIVAAIDLVNDMLKQEVLSRGLVFIDAAAAMREMNAAPLVIGGVTINTTIGSSNPTHFFVDDVHPATVGNGVFANMFLTALNVGYGQNIAQFSDLEMLTKAGLAGSYTGETSQLNYASFVYAVPEPSSWILLVVGVTAFSLGRRRWAA